MKEEHFQERNIFARLSEFAQAYKNKDIQGVLDTFSPHRRIITLGPGSNEICVGRSELKAQLEQEFRSIKDISIREQLAWAATE